MILRQVKRSDCCHRASLSSHCLMEMTRVGFLYIQRRIAAGFAGLQRALAAVPSAVFSQNVRGKPKYSVPARASCLGVKFLEYSLAGMVCGFIGQGMANGMMRIKCATPLRRSLPVGARREG